MIVRIATSVLVGVLALVPALAQQPGSAGGSLAPDQPAAKQGKSISGQESLTPPAAKPAPPAAARTARQPTTARSKTAGGKGCRSIAGTWSSWVSGQFGANDTQFGADGTITHPTSKGTWSCENGQYVHVWNLFGRRGPYRLSADGKQLIRIADGSVSFYRNGAAPRVVERASKPAEVPASVEPRVARQPAQNAGGRTGKWMAIAAVWNLDGDLAYGGAIDSTEAEAKRRAIADCSTAAAEGGFNRSMVAGCAIMKVLTNGCYYVTIGTNSSGEGEFVSGSSARDVLSKCRSRGLSCNKRPDGGCI